jgi:VWFA-related protein
MVFDKQGSFVDGLKRDQFVLKIDGKPRDISFFERIVAGSRNEEAQIAAARGTPAAGVRPGDRGPLPLDRGRTVFFFIDDLHLSPGSNKQTRQMLQRFIDREMGQNDEAAIASASGQIGFLQQLTNDKRVLHAAAERLIAKSYSTQDSDRPPMTEYQAQMIELRNEDVLGFFVTQVMRQNPGLPREVAEAQVNTRASQMLQQAAQLTNATLASLKTLVKTSAGLPGRKLIVLVSDGFLLDNRNSDSNQRLHQITSAASAAGVVIYSIDARGLTTGMPDMSMESPFDPSGRLMRGSIGDITASQDGLNALASDTGGRAFLNNNDLLAGVSKALKETAAYYLLAWRPEEAEQSITRPRHIEVSVNGRPDLVVRFHHGFGDSPPAEPVAQKKKDGKTGTKPAAELMVEALRAIYPKTELPVSISLSFLDLAQVGATLTTSIKISTNSLVLEAHEDQQLAAIDVAGAVYDDQGKSVSSFNKHLTIKAKSNDTKPLPPDNVFYNHFCTIKPGLYQVRVATVDSRNGRAGSAVSWIEIPDLSSKTLTLSSLIVGERGIGSDDPSAARPSEPGKAPEALGQTDLNVDHHFASSSHLRFLTFVYNASGGSAPATPAPPSASAPANNAPVNSSGAPANGPDLAVQVQLFRDDEPVITMPLHKIQVNSLSDSRRLPYAAEINLAGLHSGRYLLLVTVIDRAAKASASQRFGFQID